MAKPTEETTMKKITKATFKSFIKANAGNLHIKVKSTFDGMIDGCVSHNGGFELATPTARHPEHTFGFEGIYLVNGGNDRFAAVEVDGFVGIRVNNCCGSFIVGVPA
jgi:hypothetical protein